MTNFVGEAETNRDRKFVIEIGSSEGELKVILADLRATISVMNKSQVPATFSLLSGDRVHRSTSGFTSANEEVLPIVGYVYVDILRKMKRKTAGSLRVKGFRVLVVDHPKHKSILLGCDFLSNL